MLGLHFPFYNQNSILVCWSECEQSCCQERGACKTLSHLDYSDTGSVMRREGARGQVHAAILCLLEPEDQSKPGSVYRDNEVCLEAQMVSLWVCALDR